MKPKTCQQSLDALGTQIDLCLVSAQTSAELKLAGIRREILLFERRFSRFLPASELSVFNRAAGVKNPVSPEFKQLLQSAHKLSAATKGLFNPFVLPALQKAGYKHSLVPGYENDKVDDFSDRSVVGIERLEISETSARIPYGTALDLGGCGKGYLADQLTNKLADTHAGFWLSMGGDIAAFGTDENNQPWKINVQSASSPTKDIGYINLPANKPQAVATSGTIARKGHSKSQSWHHIIDPRTCQPAKTDLQLATVVCDSALWADVLASCAIILGSKAAPAFLKSQGIHTYLLQGADASNQPIIIRRGAGVHIHQAAMPELSHV